MSDTTLGEFMHWIKDQGGHCSTGHAADEKGMIPAVRLTLPSGKTAVVTGLDQYDTLALSMIAYLERRLGVLSPFGCGRPN